MMEMVKKARLKQKSLGMAAILNLQHGYYGTNYMVL